MQKVSFASINFKQRVSGMLEVIAAFFQKYMWVIIYVSFLSLLGGMAAYIRKKKSGKIEKFSLLEFVGDMVISGFVGIITYLICKGVGLNEFLTAASIGIASHQGTRAIVLAEALIPKIICKHFKVDCK